MEEKLLEIMRSVLEDATIDTSCTQENCESWNSLHHLILVSELEEAFGIELEPEEIAEMRSFARVKEIVEEKCL